MERVAEPRTRVPSHLRQFHPTSPTPLNGLFTPKQNRFTSTASRISPPRFRLSLSTALKDIVSKDWKALAQHAQPQQPRMAAQPRPDPVRMKDSDDYITERAANPRTGLISPSLGTITPCRESTPNTPGDALKLHYHEHTSPTPNPRRAFFSRANEGRKISAGSHWTNVEQEVYDDQERAGTPCTLPEDRLVVHMPSAKEPQPFAYPGYSSEQIEAFEHYKAKARRVSSEGYDQRLLQSSRNPSSTYGQPDYAHTSDEHEAHPPCSGQGQHFHPYNGLHEWPQPQLVVRKRNVRNPVCQVSEAADPSGQISRREVSNSTTHPAMMCDMERDKCLDDRHVVTKSKSGACSTSKHAQKPHTAYEKIFKKKCMAPRRGSVHGVAKGNHDDKENAPNGYSKADSTVSDMSDLLSLPRVTLVRPEHAAMPVSRGQPPVGDGGRKCSLGCRRDVSSGQCLELRKVSLPAPADRICSSELPNPKNATGLGSGEKAEEVLVGLVAWLLCYIKGIQMPQSDLIETLRSPHATAREKADALKAALSLAGHVLAVGTALAMIWQLSAAVIQLLQIALWPLAVPFRILRWFMGAA